jgi:PIN domain nuclease of toxin-antitoxin system
MKLLLDTHTFIWWESKSSQLSEIALNLIIDPQNIIFLSVASIWEMQIKIKIGKLNLSLSLPEMIQNQIENNGLMILPIDRNHVFALNQLPLHHKDPFDRINLATINTNKLCI